jgi:hypothetical protein
MTLPTFIVIGTMKGGTDSLHRYLGAHPEVFVSEKKELNYFVEQRAWVNGQSWYEEQFRDAAGARAIGEASPIYTMAQWFPGVPGRIRGVLPDAKLIYLLRHPVERMKSHYIHERRTGNETHPPDEAFRRNLGYLHGSRYAYQLGFYLEHFPREQILLVTSENLRDHRAETLRTIYGFIGVDPDFTPENAAQEFHRSVDKSVRHLRFVQARQRPLYRLARTLTPKPLRRLANRFTHTRLDTGQIVIGPEVLEKITAALRDDVANLRPYMGPDFQGWGLLGS